jgi:hypothetical protein
MESLGNSTIAATSFSSRTPTPLRPENSLRVEDGWFYFIHSWTRVIAEVFDVDIPVSGPKFERLSEIAVKATKGR